MAGSGSNPNPEEGPISASRSRSEETIERRLHILIVEDNKADVALIKKALARESVSAELHELDDGEKVIRFFERADLDPQAPCPDLILLDINMPRYKGSEILRALRARWRCRNSLVLVVTSSDSDSDRREMDSLGVNGYFRKPSAFEEFMKLGQLVKGLLALGDNPRDRPA
jgi:CheY-like chemotaxis protein